MKRSTVVFFSMLAVLALAVQSGAVDYSYHFGSMGFTDGQNLEGMNLDIATFTSETGDLRYYSGYGSGIGTGYVWGAAGDTYIQFADPVSALSFRGGDGVGDYDAFAVTLYEFGTDSLMGTWATPAFGGPAEPEWYTLNIAASNVGRLVFDPGNSGVLPGTKEGLGGLVITDMGYSTAAVPAPGAILLGALGTGLVGWLRRRRTL
jgi:hypothetical protein